MEGQPSSFEEELRQARNDVTFLSSGSITLSSSRQEALATAKAKVKRLIEIRDQCRKPQK